MSVLYLYAIAPRSTVTAEDVRGFEDAPVAWRACGELCAAVATLEHEPTVELEHLRAHDVVARRLARDVPALLPARFRQVFSDERALQDELGRQAERLLADLERVRGCEQMTWRVFGEAPPPPAVAAAAGPGTRYLAERAARRTPAGLAPLLDALAPLVREQRVEASKKAGMLASVYHLVDTTQLDAYRAELDRKRADIAPLRITVSGPWLPYAFTGGRVDD